MTQSYVEQATKTIGEILPFIDENNKVVKWKVEVKYVLNDFTKSYMFISDKMTTNLKDASEWTKAEVLALTPNTNWERNFNASYAASLAQNTEKRPTPLRTFNHQDMK
jgi:hypothetical protein